MAVEDKLLNGSGLSHLASKIKTLLTSKTDKVNNATNGNFAGLNSSGNLTDSGYDATDFLTTSDSVPSSPVSVNADTLENHAASYFAAASSLVDKVSLKPSATDGHFALFDENGDIEDSGKSISDFSKVSVSGTGTATDEVQYITVDGVEKKLASGSSGEDANAVHYTTDSGKSDAEKTQARTNIGAGTYSKPSGGIPLSDMVSAVQTSINEAEQIVNKVTTISDQSDNNHYPSAKAVYNFFGNVFSVIVYSGNDEWGTVTPGGLYTKNAIITVTATPASGCHFVNWKNANTGEILSTNASYTLLVTQNIALKASFMEDSFVPAAWATGTDAEIANMIQLADDGIITLSDYWTIGDTRTVSLDAMESDSAKGYEAHVAQTVELVLVDYTCTGFTLTDTGSKPNFIVQQKDGLLEKGQINSSNTNNGGWGACKRRGWCNDVYRMAIPLTLRGIFKQFTWQYVQSGTNGTLLTANDYFALPPEKAIFGARTYSRTEEADLFTNWAYYNSAARRVKKVGTSGSAYHWWVCSPISGNSSTFCIVNSSGSANNHYANSSILLAPFGCI